MISFLLIISFLLHIATFLAIYQLYKQTQIPQESPSKDMMDLFETYLEEVKLENKRLEETLLAKSHDETHKVPETNEKKKKTEEKNVYLTPDVGDDVQYETSLQSKILHMHGKGMSTEEIARKIDSGKTEVDLIIKLHAKK